MSTYVKKKSRRFVENYFTEVKDKVTAFFSTLFCCFFPFLKSKWKYFIKDLFTYQAKVG